LFPLCKFIIICFICTAVRTTATPSENSAVSNHNDDDNEDNNNNNNNDYLDTGKDKTSITKISCLGQTVRNFIISLDRQTVV
jgi:hypothetical protein